MAAFDTYFAALSWSRLVQTRHYYFEVKQIQAVFRRCSSK